MALVYISVLQKYWQKLFQTKPKKQIQQKASFLSLEQICWDRRLADISVQWKSQGGSSQRTNRIYSCRTSALHQ